MKPEKSLSEDQGERYPLELVAKIAAMLISGKVSGVTGPEVFAQSAEDALALIDACAKRVRDEPLRQYAREGSARWQRTEEEILRRLAAKHPNKVPWKTGILTITGRRSVGEVGDVFRRWRVFDAASKRRGFDAASKKALNEENFRAEEEIADREIAEWTSEGFSPSVIGDLRIEFSTWHEEFYLSSARRASAKKRVRKDSRK